MKMILRYMGRYRGMVVLCVITKLLSTFAELSIPYILEHIIDEIAPLADLKLALLWGLIMFFAAFLCRQLNVTANMLGIRNAHLISYDVRKDLFFKTIGLSGRQVDSFGLSSLISRMTSDSYNVQLASQQLQTMCVRSPLLLLGGVTFSLIMDASLAIVLICIIPLLLVLVLAVTAKGLPKYRLVQEKLDGLVRIMRENITGIRVIKALSKTDYEKNRFAEANKDMADCSIEAGTIMAIPAPSMEVCLNVGLTLTIFLGAVLVNEGNTQPGVILAFLTYFNMISTGVMGLSRIFIIQSKGMASARRIDEVLRAGTDLKVLPADETKECSEGAFIRFENVSFSYGDDIKSSSGFAGGAREKTLSNISFSLERGESLGIIGPTGCGKSTVVSLLMRFYDPAEGRIIIDGRDVRTYEKDELRKKFGTCFQNDMIFQETLGENISFGRNIKAGEIRRAAEEAMASEFIDELPDGFGHPAEIRGANLSGGQKQRLYVARALAGNPEIVILDDSSSALDYKTDAAMRKAITMGHRDAALIIIAQRVSSVMGMTRIMVMEDGACAGYGTHEELIETCGSYREIYQIQMGELG